MTASSSPSASPMPSSVSSRATPTPSRRPHGFPDYSVWTEERFREYPGYVTCHEIRAEVKWWWEHGYRLLNTNKAPKREVVWVLQAEALKGI
ncbi:hypothetical protein F5Y03DRAFT_402205 [Xylaria venustula]|nr:hypothetical protein F5Y03DRAFT_402205 [Xylaria venustula]